MTVLPSHFYKETYTDSAFRTLCSDFKLPENQHEKIREALEDFAAVWRWHTPEPDMVPHPSKDAKALRKVYEKAGKLLLEIKGLSFDARYQLEKTNSEGTMEATFSERTHSKYGHRFYRYIESDGLETTLTQNLAGLVRSVEILEKIAAVAKDGLTPMRQGRRYDMAMHVWMGNIANLWQKKLHRPFTRDATAAGEPISEAARFCVAVFKPINSETPNSRIFYEMKKIIAELRNSTTGKNAVKTEP